MLDPTIGANRETTTRSYLYLRVNVIRFALCYRIFIDAKREHQHDTLLVAKLIVG